MTTGQMTGAMAGLNPALKEADTRLAAPRRMPAAVLLARELVGTLVGGLVYGQDFWRTPTLEERVRAQRDGITGEAMDRAWRRF